MQLTGEPFDLEELVRLFDQPSIRVLEQQGAFVLESAEFQRCTSAAEVRQRAQEIIVSINGAARLALPQFRSATLGAVVEQTHHGRSVHAAIVGSVTVRAKVNAVLVHTGSSAAGPRAPVETNAWIALAIRDEPVRRLLRLVSEQGSTWQGLYKMMEIVQSTGGDALLVRCGISGNELKRFSQTANSMHAVGDQARHAKESMPAPRRPMSLDEASRLITRWSRAWITNRSI